MRHPLARSAPSGPVGILWPGQSLLVPTRPEDAETQGRRPPCALKNIPRNTAPLVRFLAPICSTTMGRAFTSSALTQNRNKPLFWPPLGGEIGPPECPWAGGRQHGRPVAARYRLGRPLPPPRPPPASRTLARGDFPRISASRDSSCYDTQSLAKKL